MDSEHFCSQGGNKPQRRADNRPYLATGGVKLRVTRVLDGTRGQCFAGLRVYGSNKLPVCEATLTERSIERLITDLETALHMIRGRRLETPLEEADRLDREGPCSAS